MLNIGTSFTLAWKMASDADGDGFPSVRAYFLEDSESGDYLLPDDSTRRESRQLKSRWHHGTVPPPESCNEREGRRRTFLFSIRVT